MEYFVKIQDDEGYIHSIDKLSVVWQYNQSYGFNGVVRDSFFDTVRDTILDFCTDAGVNPEVKSNLKPSSKFAWTLHYIHVKFGLPIFIGYQNFGKNGDIQLKNCVRLEFNPNKVYQDDRLLDDVIRILNAFNPTSVNVMRLDYSIDIPYEIDDLVVLQSRKNKRYFKDTIYLGQRGEHNSVKIYNKFKEIFEKTGEDIGTLTRFEITCKHDKKIKFDNIQIMRGDKIEMEKEPSSNTKTIVKMCLALKQAGYDYSDFISKLNSRKRNEVIYLVEGLGQRLIFDDVIFEDLYKQVVEKLNLGIQFEVIGKTRESYLADLEHLPDGEFLTLPDDFDLPFNED